MKAICVGHSTYDITFPVNGYPEENLKYRIDNSVECGGGPASNGAYLLSKWGITTSIVSAVGNDYYGEKIKEEFENIGADTTYLELRDDIDTSASFILANLENGNRTIFTSKRKHIRKLDCDVNIKGDIILIDGEHPETAEEVLNNNKDAISVLDAGRVNDDTKKLGRMVNYVVCSHDFAEEFTGIKIDYNNMETLKIIYNKLKEYYDTNIVITLERKGSFTIIDNEYKIIPSINVKAIDSTGAGDIFHGAFIYFLSQGYDLKDVIRYASITGALSTTRIGSRLSIPTLKEVLDYDNIL